jgi:hypothetical protein
MEEAIALQETTRKRSHLFTKKYKAIAFRVILMEGKGRSPLYQA